MKRAEQQREDRRMIVVCAHCLRASCAQEHSPCAVRTQGLTSTIAYPLRTLRKLAKEPESYWGQQ